MKKNAFWLAAALIMSICANLVWAANLSPISPWEHLIASKIVVRKVPSPILARGMLNSNDWGAVDFYLPRVPQGILAEVQLTVDGKREFSNREGPFFGGAKPVRLSYRVTDALDPLFRDTATKWGVSALPKEITYLTEYSFHEDSTQSQYVNGRLRPFVSSVRFQNLPQGGWSGVSEQTVQFNEEIVLFQRYAADFDKPVFFGPKGWEDTPEERLLQQGAHTIFLTIRFYPLNGHSPQRLDRTSPAP